MSEAPIAASPLDVDVRWHFVCTKCRLRFAGENSMKATCPECGSTYDHFSTPLLRCGSFAIAYWLNDSPGEIRDHEAAPNIK